MSSHGDQLKSALGLSALISMYGVLSLLVLFLGPQFGYGYLAQGLLIALILATWPFALLINHYRKKREERREQQQQAAAMPAAAPQVQAGAPAKPTKPGKPQLPPVVGTYEALSRGVEEVVQWLRGTKLSGKKSKTDAVYALPWFLVTGPQGGGKTSLLLSSAFSFQVLPSQRAADLHVIRPTDNCEFRVTNEAVWLDTTGRYQTEGPDRDEWAALVETLKRYRRQRPLDGLVIAVDAGLVLRWNETEIEQQAKVLRARLEEAMLRVGMKFPVYLVFTHADAIEGFGEFFKYFQGPERGQVWGTTFPLAQAQNAQAFFDAEFDHLYGRLLRRRTIQLETATRPPEQLRVFKFPGRFRRSRQKLGQFVSALFRPNPFSESPVLRGFYFTNSAGDGTPGARQLSPAGVMFTPQLFHEVILGDRDVVAAQQASKSSPGLVRNVLLGAAAALVLFLLAGSVVSFLRNRQLVAEARARGVNLINVRNETSKNFTDETAAVRELNAIEGMRGVLSELDLYERTSPPLFMRFGLYAGDEINEEGSSFRSVYIEAVEQRYTRPAFLKMTEDLRAFVGGQRRTPASAETSSGDAASASSSQANSEEKYLEQYYDLLKAYLMLARPEKVESAFLANQLRGYWRALAPRNLEEEALRQLEFYASQAHKRDVTHFEPDQALVAQARKKLEAYPVISRVYKRLTSDINQKLGSPVNLSTIASVRETNDRLLSSSYSVPPAYTVEGYARWRDVIESSAAEEFRRDDWVMGNETADQGFNVQREELNNIYLQDYSAQWQRFMQEVKVREYQKKEKDDAENALKKLASSTSPMSAVLREVARQTNLSGSTGVVAWVKSWFGSKDEGGGGTPVDREFRPVIRFVEGKEEGLTEYRNKLNFLAGNLGKTNRSIEELAKRMQNKQDDIQFLKTRREVTELLLERKQLKSTPAAETAAKLLLQPLDNLNSLLVGTEFEQMEKAWQQMLTRSWQQIEAGFPVADGGG
ncbi:MAG TPA: type VI secretion system membrane subunit TssM, partial [Pyrinomonadaceae bacterium]|nr:type VI secretion system membrane subunit TssM [Pyrinomonadaceae bacterium]